jgi:uncharacterized protein (DUF433 family)
MALVVGPETLERVPLVSLPNGAIRIEGTRVPFEIVVHAFSRGDTPEQIVQNYPTVTLANAYSVLAFYLHHQDEVDEYIAQQAAEAVEVERKVTVKYGPGADIRARLLSRRQATQTRD